VTSIDTGWVGASAVNLTDLPDEVILPSVRETAQYLQNWVRETRAQKAKPGSLFDRTKFTAPKGPYEEMEVARTAVRDDDVVSAAADVTEGLILQGTAWGSSSEKAADVMNQVSAGLDLDGYLRAAYREQFTYSQVVSAVWWGRRDFVPRVRTTSDTPNADGSKRTYPQRKAITLNVPTRIVTLDPRKVVPIGDTIFGEQRLAWHATAGMMSAWTAMEDHPIASYDATMAALFLGPYTPSDDEAMRLSEWGVDPKRLIEFRPGAVWRHTRTKPDYEPFPDLRMRSVFRLLDLKQQLLESDRVMLVGAANYILLVKKGSDAQPASQPEVDNLKEGFQVIAKLPVIVSDHRLSIEIISPKLDATLIADKYDLLDSRILARLFGAPTVNSGARGDQTAGTTTRMMQRHLETQRHMLRRTVEERIRDAIWEHPGNAEALRQFKPDEKPSLFFTPRNVQLDNDSQVIASIMAARQSRDLSRESFLETLGFDQDVEAQRMKREADLYDDIFQTQVPFSADGGDGNQGAGDKPSEPSQVSGARGGRPAGGGQSPQSAKGQVKRRTASGAPSTGGAK
jgi:hypothetical protein